MESENHVLPSTATHSTQHTAQKNVPAQCVKEGSQQRGGTFDSHSGALESGPAPLLVNQHFPSQLLGYALSPIILFNLLIC